MAREAKKDPNELTVGTEVENTVPAANYVV